MPCQTPYRGDTSQMLLFKIASCLEADGGGGSVTAAQIIAALGCTPACEGDVVTSFNGQTGDVVLTLADISTLADGRYVLKAGDTMTGALAMPDGTAALPSLTFSGDTDTGIYRVGVNSLGFSTVGVARWRIDASGNLYTAVDGVGDIGDIAANRPNNIRAVLDISGTTLTANNNVVAGNAFVFSGEGAIIAPSDGVFTLLDNANTSFGRLQFGGTTSAFPSIKRSAATLQFRLADDSAFAGISTAAIVMSTAAPLSITSGANQRAGDAVLVGGTVTVANTTVTANTRVYLTRKVAGGTIGFAVTYTLIAATSFTITSDNVLDTSTYSYLLIEVP